jgi:hypothetical protein
MPNVSTAGVSSSRPTTAPRWKSCWPMTSLKTSVASMLKLPPITFGMPKSVITSVKATSAAEISPYFAPGSVIVKNLRRSTCRARRRLRRGARRRAPAR